MYVCMYACSLVNFDNYFIFQVLSDSISLDGLKKTKGFTNLNAYFQKTYGTTVYMYVCMYMYVCICMYVYVSLCICMHMYVYVYLCMYVNVMYLFYLSLCCQAILRRVCSQPRRTSRRVWRPTLCSRTFS